MKNLFVSLFPSHLIASFSFKNDSGSLLYRVFLITLSIYLGDDSMSVYKMFCLFFFFMEAHYSIVCVCAQSCPTLTPWTVAHQAPLSMGFLRQEYWSGLPFPPPILLYAAAAAAKSLQSCLTVQPHRRQPTRLPCPWDSQGKNTGVGCHFLLQCMKVKSESEVAQSCPTLCDPMDSSPPGSSVHGILQARILEWIANSFSRGSSQLRDRALVSCIAGRFFTVWATMSFDRH